ncbi:cytochrome P450 oxidoreductase [Mycena galopus ATCC 62051]|nr:cytochrome P450 oxidoreductase [Mycena galopus ATCC 62051]
MLFLSSVRVYALLFFVLAVAYLLRNKFRPHLSSIPGPPLAAYTGLWRLHDVWKGDAHHTAISLHKKYGPLVRIGPNHVSVDDLAEAQTIYDTKQTFIKSAFYPLQATSWKKKPALNIFATRDPRQHRDDKRKVANSYTVQSMLQSEGAIDTCSALFLQRLEEIVVAGKPVNLGEWLQYYAFDVVGEVTFSTKFGFLEKGMDVDGIIAAIRGILTYVSLCGQVPVWHQVLLGNPVITALMPAMETWNQVLVFTLKAINGRASIKRDGELIDGDNEGVDQLSRWAAVKRSDPLKMGTRDIVVHTSANVFAGSDTTSIAMRAAIYLLCRNPGKMAKVVAEIDDADARGLLSRPLISYKESIAHLPYCTAALKEAIRMHSSIGLLMERHVPAGGATICGRHIPGGTIVGINPWVVNYNPSIFPEPEKYQPERWLAGAVTNEAHAREMEKAFELNFGHGARVCLGKHMSLIEMHKIIPELFRNFCVELDEPEKEWKTTNRWFVKQEGVICNLTRREVTVS